MVSQKQNDEWETPPSRNGSTLSLDYRQQPPAVRTPPSYFDAVRSRHSLSQPDTPKPEKPLSPQHMKYNSLPRPLPQRLQTCPPNIYDAQQAPRTVWSDGPQQKQLSPENGFSRPPDANSGFQVYTRPPGPANHVPLSPRNQLLMMSNSSSLPRCFPRVGGKLEISNPNVPRDVHQPLSIIVKHDFNGPPMAKQGDYQKKMTRPPLDETRFAAPPMRRAQPPLPPEPMKNHPAPIHPGHVSGPSRTNSLPRSQEHGGHAFMTQYKPDMGPNKHHQQYPSYHYPNATNYPRYSRNGTLPFQHPRRDYIVEPAICIRTGPLGSYPEPGSLQNNTIRHPPKPLHTSKSQNLLECAEVSTNQSSFSRRHDPSNAELARSSMSNQPHPAHSSLPPRSLPPPSSPMNHQSVIKNPKQQRNGSEAFQEYTRSSTLPRKKSRDKMATDFSIPDPSDFTIEHSTVVHHSSSTNGMQNSNKVSSFSPNKLHHHLSTSLSDQHFSHKISEDDDSHSSTPSKGISRETPEEAGLVMIVESRELHNRVNSIAKDLVKPTPRIPMSPTFSLPTANSAVNNGMIMNHHRDQPYSPSPNFSAVGSQMYSYHTQIPSNGNLPKSHHISSEDISSPISKSFGNREVFRAVPGNRTMDTQPIKPQNGSFLRRTPLSSSTASLSSEISSVCSRSKKTPEVFQKRVTPSRRKSSSDKNIFLDDKGKKNEISNSPWVREEKEELQKQQILGARRARDEEISYLESLTDRTMKQNEWLRILRLEREFQRRAEEMDDDDDEDDEVLLERAEHRERMLMMQEETQNNSPPKSRSTTQSSSDQWLANSQAKQPKRSKDHGGNFSLNGSFEIEHFNDLLETMNMSPVIRDEDIYENIVNSNDMSPHHTSTPERIDITNGFRHELTVSDSRGQLQTKPVPAPRVSKAVSPVLYTPNADRNVSNKTCMDFCFPVENVTYDLSETLKANTMCLLSKDCGSTYEERKQSLVSKKAVDCNDVFQCKSPSQDTYSNGSLKTTKTISPSDIKLQSEPGERQYSKLALRIPLKSVGKERSTTQEFFSRNGSQEQRNVKTDISPTKQKEESVFLSRISNGGGLRSPQEQDCRYKDKLLMNYKPDARPVSNGNFAPPYSPTKFQNGMSNSLNNDFDGKSTEYKKIWNSRPEKLTFMDKIKKFSLQAGDDDIPKDKVKNSRAQRELEMKFNGELNKTTA